MAFMGRSVKSVSAGIAHLFSALCYSVQGLVAAFKDEVAFRQECLIAVPHFIAVVCLPLELWMRFYLAALWFVLIAVELLNTSVEAVVNLVSPEWNALAKKAKDCGSAAVSCIIVLYVVSWVSVIFKLVVCT